MLEAPAKRYADTMVDLEKTQLDKFKEAARDLECDDDEERFNAALKKIAIAGKKPVEENKGK